MADPTIFSADPYVLEFIKGNLVSLSMLLALLKGLAVLTKSVHDDKVVTLLQRVLGMGVPGPAGTAKPVDRPLEE